MQKPEPELARVLNRHAGALVAALPSADSDLCAQAKEAIFAGLKQGQASVGAVSKRLGIGDRTLQRRLAELGTSHAKLEARSELALRYLREEAAAISEIAVLLGFTDVSAFHRAFRRWTGDTPAELRRRARAELHPS